jgi:hypothetical protein
VLPQAIGVGGGLGQPAQRPGGRVQQQGLAPALGGLPVAPGLGDPERIGGVEGGADQRDAQPVAALEVGEGVEVEGRIEGDTMSGSARSDRGAEVRWQARRTARR